MSDHGSFKTTIIEQALTCAAFAKENKLEDNRGLATIGDSLLSFLVLDYLYEHKIASTMEDLTNWKSLIQTNKILDKMGKKIFESNKEILAQKNDLNGKKTYATILEAYVYAMYKSEGLDATKAFINQAVIQCLKETSVNEEILAHLNQIIENETNGKNWEKLKNDYLDFKP